jgi:signal transduction histidine kinase
MQLSTRRKTFVGYAVTTALVLVLGVAGIVFVSSVMHRFERLSGDDTHRLVLAERLRTSAAVIDAENRTALLAQDAFVGERDRHAREFDATLAELRSSADAAHDGNLVESVAAAHVAYVKEYQRALASRAPDGSVPAATQLRLGYARSALSLEIDSLVQLEQKRYTQAAIATARFGGALHIAAIILTATAVIVVAGLGGWLTHVVGVGLEAEQKRRAEAERAHADAEAARADAEAARAQAQLQVRLREDLLAIVSHDLRGPLMVFTTGIALLRKTAIPDTARNEVIRALGPMERSADRMLAMIRDLLDAARIEGDQFTVEPRPTSVAEVVERATELYTAPMLGKRVDLDVDIEDKLVALCEPERVIQVLSNLLGNAVKFTPEGGRIRLSARADGDWTRFVVSDNGSGIAAEQIPRLFDRYSRGRYTPGAGTGLGLYIANGIVCAHGGRIEVDSEPGCGTTFEFTLPRVAGLSLASSEDAAAPISTNGQG